jgi:predicted RNase H-like HicB family nuclease
MKQMHLTGVLEREGDGYCSYCPQLEVASQGNSVEEALANLKEAVELFLECASPAEIETRYRPEIFVTQFEANYA